MGEDSFSNHYTNKSMKTQTTLIKSLQPKKKGFFVVDVICLKSCSKKLNATKFAIGDV